MKERRTGRSKFDRIQKGEKIRRDDGLKTGHHFIMLCDGCNERTQSSEKFIDNEFTKRRYIVTVCGECGHISDLREF